MGRILVFATVLALCYISALASAPIFYESFDETWETRWIPSANEDYKGVWKHEKSEGHDDFGLVVSEKARKYGLATVLPEIVEFKDEPVVLQFEVRFQNGIECGGAYLKFLLPQGVDWNPSQLDSASPYSIMFGPDKCGSTNKVHFIFRHKNPKTGDYIEHHLKSPPSPVTDKLSHVYTAIIYPDNSVSIMVDGAVKKSGNLLSDKFDPPVLPKNFIPDPEDKKPEDWDDKAKIPDPDATKPEDWDEDAPYEVEDMEAQKPEGWLDDEPEEIDDEAAVKPDEWEEEEDGEWEPPKIPNPKCEAASGCGEWERPTIKNPAFKGKWYAPMIDNPNYKGIWKPREIPNPDYFHLEKPNLESIGAIAIEIWTMNDGILFDNILVTRDEGLAQEYRDKEWRAKFDVEEKQEEKDVVETVSPGFIGKIKDVVFKALYAIAGLPFLGAYKEKLMDLIAKAEEKPNFALSVVGAVLLLTVVFVYKILFRGRTKPSKQDVLGKAKKEDISSADDVNTEKREENVNGKEEREGEATSEAEDVSRPRHRHSRRET